MSCYNKECSGEIVEEVKFIRGNHVQHIPTCSDHKPHLLTKSWEDISGIAHHTFKPHFGFPATSLPGGPNQNVNVFQSGTANVPTPESTGGQLQNTTANIANSFIQSQNTPGAFEDVDWFAFISGNLITVINPITNAVVASGTNAWSVLTSGLSLTTAGQVFHLNRGQYNLTSSLIVPGKQRAIIGTPDQPGGGGANLNVGGNYPALIISGANQVTLRDLYFTHNVSGFTGPLFQMTNDCEQCFIRDLNFYDNGQLFTSLSGVAIQLDNGGGANGPTNCFLEDVSIFGFNTCIRVICSGGPNLGFGFPFINNIMFSNHIWQDFGAQAFQLVCQSGAFDGNVFSNIQVQVSTLSGTQAVFDYSTQTTTNMDCEFNKHIGVVVEDLSASGVYAAVNAVTQIDMIACVSDWKISGATNNLIHYSLHTNDRGTTNITSSGTTTTSYFIPFNIKISNQAPRTVSMNPANTATAQQGSWSLQSITISGFNAVCATSGSTATIPSGIALSWIWQNSL